MRLVRLFKLLLILTPLLSTSGCQTLPSEAPPIWCPPRASYTADENARARIERLKAMASGQLWPRYFDDYGKLRAECNAAENKGQ